MAEINVHNQLTLVEIAKRSLNKNALKIAELLAKKNAILDDAVWVEANDVTSHVTTKRTLLPAGSWRGFNEGVSSEASATSQFREDIGMLETESVIDAELAKLASGGERSLRSDEDSAFVEGLGQTLATALFYGNKSADIRKINGFATRYNLTSLDNVIGQSGTGSDTTSVWIIEWGKDACHLIYPKGAKAGGIEIEDCGKIRVTDSNGKSWMAWSTRFRAHVGLVVRDDRAVQRIVNIETSGTTNILDEDNLIASINLLPSLGDSAVIYCNRTIMTQLDIIAKDKTNVNYNFENWAGKRVLTFRGVPVKLCENIVNTETAVS